MTEYQMRLATLADYRWLYDHGYMPDGLACARAVMLEIVERCPATFLDYGGGRGDLCQWINKHTRGICWWWDPAVGMGIGPGDARADYVIACDVLEHVPPDELAATLRELDRLSMRGLLLTIANMPDVVPINGEQVELHAIQKPAEWWMEKLRAAWPGETIITHRPIERDRFAIIVDFR